MALIELEAAQRRFENYRMDCEEAGDAVAAQVFADCITELEDVPTIDAAPVVHGRWMFNADMWTWDCTNCKGWVGSGVMVSRYKHCPNCGARMDGGEGHETD